MKYVFRLTSWLNHLEWQPAVENGVISLADPTGGGGGGGGVRGGIREFEVSIS